MAFEAEAVEPSGPVLAGSITKLPQGAAGRVVVCGSHGGAYPARLALAGGIRAVILNDAGVGLDGAGIASLAICEQAGMAAATASSASCRIGDPQDMMARGRISFANALASACGVAAGETVALAARKLAAAVPPPSPPGFPGGEERSVVAPENALRRIVLIDSASLVRAEDSGQVVVTGSHGGLFDPDPARALGINAFAAIFNDAGGGADDWGRSRLPVLAMRGIVAATVASSSARIGDARSTWQDGVLSAVNAPGFDAGLRQGQTCREAVALLCSMASLRH